MKVMACRLYPCKALQKRRKLRSVAKYCEISLIWLMLICQSVGKVQSLLAHDQLIFLYCISYIKRTTTLKHK